METQSAHSSGSRVERWIALALYAAVLAAGVPGQFFSIRPFDAGTFTPDWSCIAAAVLAAAGTIWWNGISRWHRVQRVLLWTGLLLMVWAANGLPFDLLRIVGLIPTGVDWSRLVTKTLALAASVILARLVLMRPAESASTRAASWYGYAAFALALPYPVMRTIWALGGTLGIMQPGAAGEGFTPWFACTPWLLAAVVSLLLVPTWRWMPRRLLLTTGWSATAIVATIAPAACWALVTQTVGGELGLEGISNWVPCLFYGSWFLWAIAAAAATRSYQIRSIAH
jgi:hypothetical protein